MKKKILSLVISLFIGSFLLAQDAKITENLTSNWPFYFEDFTPAKIVFNTDKESFTETSININVFSGELQYLDNSKTIRILDNIEDVKLITVAGGIQFVFVNDFVHRVVNKSANYIITEQKKGQLSDLQESTGAYGGSTATASVNNLDGKLIGGINNFDYTFMIENKEGTSFKPELKYFLVGQGFSILLTKRNLNKQFPLFGKKLSSFLKKEKLSLKNEESFSQILDFIENQK